MKAKMSVTKGVCAGCGGEMRVGANGRFPVHPDKTGSTCLGSGKQFGDVVKARKGGRF